MVNILFYNTYPIDPEHGGTERVTDLVAHYLKSIGYTIYYLVRVDMGKSLENADIRTFFLPDSARGDSPEYIFFRSVTGKTANRYIDKSGCLER